MGDLGSRREKRFVEGGRRRRWTTCRTQGLRGKGWTRVESTETGPTGGNGTTTGEKDEVEGRTWSRVGKEHLLEQSGT